MADVLKNISWLFHIDFFAGSVTNDTPVSSSKINAYFLTIGAYLRQTS